jgi:hypothetical protein
VTLEFGSQFGSQFGRFRVKNLVAKHFATF